MKAILVIDEMPIKCEDCPLHYRKRQDIYRCEMTHKNIRLNSKPSWCPLKPLPQKKEETFAYWIAHCNDPESYICGWNACIDEITGETE